MSCTDVSWNEVTLMTEPFCTRKRKPPEPFDNMVSITVNIQAFGSGWLLCQALTKSTAPIARKRSVYETPPEAVNGTDPREVVVPLTCLKICRFEPLMSALYQLLLSVQRSTAPILTAAPAAN